MPLAKPEIHRVEKKAFDLSRCLSKSKRFEGHKHKVLSRRLHSARPEKGLQVARGRGVEGRGRVCEGEERFEQR